MRDGGVRMAAAAAVGAVSPSEGAASVRLPWKKASISPSPAYLSCTDASDIMA